MQRFLTLRSFWLRVRNLYPKLKSCADDFEVDDSSYVNGQVFAVDGGLSASLPVVPGKFA